MKIVRRGSLLSAAWYYDFLEYDLNLIFRLLQVGVLQKVFMQCLMFRNGTMPFFSTFCLFLDFLCPFLFSLYNIQSKRHSSWSFKWILPFNSSFSSEFPRSVWPIQFICLFFLCRLLTSSVSWPL